MFYEASSFVPLIGWAPLIDTTDKQTDLFLRTFVRLYLLDGV